jgi:hypothetical protein
MSHNVYIPPSTNNNNLRDHIVCRKHVLNIEMCFTYTYDVCKNIFLTDIWSLWTITDETSSDTRFPVKCPHHGRHILINL